MSAVLSDCGTYRYALWRDLGALLNTGCCLFVMLNPSTADASLDDPTIRRCKTFADRLGYGRLAVANLYAFRSADPADLNAPADPVGSDNDDWIRRLADEADRIVVAWGADVGPIRDRGEQVLRLLGDDVDALALTATGQPRHPLYVKGQDKNGKPIEPIPYPAVV